MTTTDTDFRKNNGITLLEHGNVVKETENTFIVVSQSVVRQTSIPLNYWKMYGFVHVLILNTVKLNPVNIYMLSNYL